MTRGGPVTAFDQTAEIEVLVETLGLDELRAVESIAHIVDDLSERAA
jgi:hypothetical protein